MRECFRCCRYKSVSFIIYAKIYTISPHCNLPHSYARWIQTPSSPKNAHPSKMFLPESKPHLPTRRLLGRPLDIPCRGVRPAEINPHVRFQTPLQPTNICTIHDAIPHGTEQSLEIRSAEIRPGCQFREGISGDTDAVEVDVGGGVEIQALREVGVDSQELEARAGICGCVLGLGFEAAEKRLEPFKGARVFADPDELHSSEARRGVRARTEMPDVFQDAGPGGDADAGADEDGDFVVEDVFGGGAVRAVDPDIGHRLVVLQGNFIDA